ncbi:hypothetical protein LCGC14_1659410 [marine sediment metagenome]|uniref:Uncharacterized protein n=1 Tax=marine sediment metagenome TaxID=412755 RepID=A0A0F9HVA9_9ZZZZ
MSDNTLASCTFCGETGITFPHTCKPGEVGELPWTVDAKRIRELLLDMHEPNCSGDDCKGENSCPACLCCHALYRLTRKIDEGKPHLCSRCETVHVLPRFGEPDRCPVNRFKPYEALDDILEAASLGHEARIRIMVSALRAYITGMER